MKSIHLKIHGLVQGVFFRQQTQKMAMAAGLNGTVRNCRDGTVEVIAEGEEKSLSGFIQWCNRGPERARVIRVDIHEMPLKNFPDFRILK